MFTQPTQNTDTFEQTFKDLMTKASTLLRETTCNDFASDHGLIERLYLEAMDAYGLGSPTVPTKRLSLLLGHARDVHRRSCLGASNAYLLTAAAYIQAVFIQFDIAEANTSPEEWYPEHLYLLEKGMDTGNRIRFVDQVFDLYFEHLRPKPETEATDDISNYLRWQLSTALDTITNLLSRLDFDLETFGPQALHLRTVFNKVEWVQLGYLGKNHVLTCWHNVLSQVLFARLGSWRVFRSFFLLNAALLKFFPEDPMLKDAYNILRSNALLPMSLQLEESMLRIPCGWYFQSCMDPPLIELYHACRDGLGVVLPEVPKFEWGLGRNPFFQEKSLNTRLKIKEVYLQILRDNALGYADWTSWFATKIQVMWYAAIHKYPNDRAKQKLIMSFFLVHFSECSPVGILLDAARILQSSKIEVLQEWAKFYKETWSKEVV